MDSFVKQVDEALTRHCHIERTAALLVALSGGADSVALLCALLAAGWRVEAAHCNFHLRGEESDRDQRFVESLCRKHGVRLHIAGFDTLDEARRNGESIEMAARRLRYEWFDRLLDARGLAAVAVAHHADDNAETLLLHLVRGTGWRGLAGMGWRRGRVVRPMLRTERREAEAYLARCGQDYVTDSSNLVPDVKRNRIRLQVMPLLRELNPSIVQTLTDTATRMAEAGLLADNAVAAARERVCRETEGGLDIDITALRKEGAAATLLHEWLGTLGFSVAQTDDMAARLDGASGARYEAPGWLLVRDRGKLCLRPANGHGEPFAMDADGCYALPDGRKLHRTTLTREALGSIPRDAATACLDADRLGQLVCRPVRRGDRFQPYGMKGSKLVSDYLTDRKRTLHDKARAYVLCSDETIAWLVGERPDQRFALTPTTRRVVVIRLETAGEESPTASPLS